MSQRGKVELVKYSKDKNTQSFEYLVEHSNAVTTLNSRLIVSKSIMTDWVAELDLGDFPQQKTPEEAAHKMADWIERLAAAIRSGEYMPIPKSEFKELK